jgi:hypothetical protein
MALTEATKKEMKDLVKDALMDGMFGDGQEEDYIMGGFPSHKGLDNMTDKELLDEYKQVFIDDHDDEFPADEDEVALYEQAKKEMGI